MKIFLALLTFASLVGYVIVAYRMLHDSMPIYALPAVAFILLAITFDHIRKHMNG